MHHQLVVFAWPRADLPVCILPDDDANQWPYRCGRHNTFLAIPDRGPNATPYNVNVDDTTSYITHFQTFSLYQQDLFDTRHPSGKAHAP